MSDPGHAHRTVGQLRDRGNLRPAVSCFSREIPPAVNAVIVDVLSARHEIYRPTPWAVPGKSVHIGCDGDNTAKSTLESLKSPEIKIVVARNNTAVVCTVTSVFWLRIWNYREIEICSRKRSPIRFFFQNFQSKLKSVLDENNLRVFVPPPNNK